MTATPAEIRFDIRPAHVLEGPAIVPGWLCLVCFRYFASVDQALKVKCEAAA